ncbi:MAG TPA: hypothetical protein VE153_34580 [Myxococcus sp.]|nr:hypothetical protein [Myxococcus sp.]
MSKWTGVLAVALSTLVLAACGSLEEPGAPEDTLGQQEAGIDVCGNGICFRSELSTCPEDCNYGGYCGDGSCTYPENSSTCSNDCRSGGGCFAPEEEPKEPPQSFDICGNGICFRSELSTCPEDCNYGGYCGDGSCTYPESSSTCSSDCRSGC